MILRQCLLPTPTAIRNVQDAALICDAVADDKRDGEGILVAAAACATSSLCRACIVFRAGYLGRG